MIRRAIADLGRFLAGLLPRAPEVDTWATLDADAQREPPAPGLPGLFSAHSKIDVDSFSVLA